MADKKKILIRIGSLRHGGAEKTLVTFLKNISSDKYEIDLLLNLYSGKYLNDVPKWINIYYLNKGEMITTNRIQDIPQKAFRVIYQEVLKKYPKLLYKYILYNKEYDIEFAAIQGIGEDVLNSPIKNSKKILWVHSDLSNVPEFTNSKIKSFFKFDHILVISDKINQFFLDLASSDDEKNKIVRIINPIDTTEILELSKEKIDMVKDNSIKTFISVGTNLEHKGYDRLVKIHKNLLNKGLIHKILIVGECSDKMKQLINQYKVEKSFILLGYQKNPYPFFELADYYVLSSRIEGYPTVVFEALLLNKFVLATDVSGVRDMIVNGDNGIVVNNTDVDLENAMEYLIKSDIKNTDNFSKNLYSLKDSVTTIENLLN